MATLAVRAMAIGLCLGLLFACAPGGRPGKPDPAIPVSDAVHSILNRLAPYQGSTPDEPGADQQARGEAVRAAKDAVLDTRRSFGERVTLACWLQQMRVGPSDVVIAELASAAHGQIDADSRVVYALGMLIWNAALRASEDPYRWQESSKSTRLARQGLDILRRATDAEQGNGLYALSAIYADYLLTGRLQGTLISWRWDDAAQAECAARIEPLLARFAGASELQGMAGPPYFTPLESWTDYTALEMGGGLYNGEYASAIMPACLVLVLRDYGRRQETGEMPQILVAVEKLLQFEPKSQSRLSTTSVALRALAQTLEQMIFDPALRGEAAALTQDARGLYEAISDDWLGNYADEYAKVATRNRRAALRLEKGFVDKYTGRVSELAREMREFVTQLNPEAVDPKAPPAPW